jgi:hypothetical protein
MDVYLFASLLATIVAIALRRLLLVRVLAVALLLWIGAQQHLDLRQAERMLMQVDTPSDPQSAASRDLDADKILRVLQRTPTGFFAFLCAGALALVPVGRRPSDIPETGTRNSEEHPA